MRSLPSRPSQDGDAPVLIGASDVFNARAFSWLIITQQFVGLVRVVRLRSRVTSTPNSYDGHAVAIYLIPTGSPIGD